LYADVAGQPLASIFAWSWSRHVELALQGFKQIGANPICVRYEELVQSPAETMLRVCESLNLPVRKSASEIQSLMSGPSRTTVTSPMKGKWARHRPALYEMLPLIGPIGETLGYEMLETERHDF
jgi:hypothetical protein